MTAPNANEVQPAEPTLTDILAGEAPATRSTFDIDFTELIPEATVPELARKPALNAVLDSYLNTVKELERVMSRQQQLEKSLFGASMSEDIRTKCVTELGDSAVQRLIQRARREFAPSGSELQIDVSDVLRATKQSEQKEKYRDRYWRKEKKDTKFELDLDCIWAYLETTYGGENGKRLGLSQQVAVLVDAFRMNDEEDIKRTSSHVCCYKRVYSEKQEYGSEKGRYQLSYSYREVIQRMCIALVCFAEWAELDALAIAIDPRRHPLADYQHYFDLRSKHSFPGMEVVLFKEKWEWRFSHDVAEKLMLFVGEFAAGA